MGRQTSVGKEARRSMHSAKVKKSNQIKKKILILILWIGIICCITGLTLLYGPYRGFREWLITTANSTMTHQYLATWFYDETTIAEALERNKLIEVIGSTDTSQIQFIVDDNKGPFENKYEEAVLKRADNNNDYKIIRIKEEKFTGYLAVIYDPSRIKTVATSNMGKSGEYLSELSRKNHSLVGINAGGFADDGGNGTGGTPLGITICSGKVVTENPYNNSGLGGGLIGFNEQNILILDSNNNTDGIRDGVTFGPFLIVNGETSKITGPVAGGRSPRSAIAQRADGKVLFLVLDGDRNLGRGATYSEEIEILKNYGAINAANLDGGTSTCMTVGDTLINDPTSKDSDGRSRQIATAFILTDDGQNNGDHSVVANKLN